ncbi:MAG: hypothetical protein K0Q49_901 [Haloplasmataceae bacterium]|jgi:UDP-N-acetylmuramoyl-tripeptide--D-alanyl-D-alanine ligase|nr:hypothetical protein [Haloplasmataceae bacterium]
MILIGMLHHRKNPNTIKKSYAYAATAKIEGAELLYFTPKSVDFENRIINGYKYIEGKWEKVQDRFPDVIYKTGLSMKFVNSKAIIKKLRKEIPFTSHSIGDKMTIYNSLRENEELKSYLIPSIMLNTYAELNDFLNKYQKVVLKTNHGHRGIGVVYIEKLSDRYKIISRPINYVLTHYEFKNIMIEKLNEQSHHIQPYIESKTKSGNSYILRSHIQKNGENNWVVTSIFPEIAHHDSIIANLNCGGTTNKVDIFLSQEFGSKYLELLKQIETLSFKIAYYLENYQKQNKKGAISELGIDIGINDNEKLWIIEVNDLPGCPPTFDLELDVVKNQIKYAIFLAKKNKEKED